MYKVLIIDDEPLARMLVKEMLQQHNDCQLCGECSDGFEGLKKIQEVGPDLVFLDVQMPRINGFEMLEVLDDPPAVIFTTAFDEYAIRAFEQNAMDYLLKPFSQDRFDQALQKFRERYVQPLPDQLSHTVDDSPALPGQNDRIVIRDNGQVKIIPIQDVFFLEAADDFVKVHLEKSHFLKKKTMASFEKTLPMEGFVRVHRSFIISVSRLTKLVPYEKDGMLAVLSNGMKIPVSKSGYARLKTILGI